MEKTSVILKQCWIQANKRLLMNMQKTVFTRRVFDCKIYHDPGTVYTTRKTNDPCGVDNLLCRVHGGKTEKNGVTGDILQVDIKRSTYKDK